MAQTLALKAAGPIVLDLVETINANRAYLSEIDGLIGDGDHGINMSKGFTLCGEALRAHPELPGLAEGLDTLAMTLLEGIGGSMGPLYGSFFLGSRRRSPGRRRSTLRCSGRRWPMPWKEWKRWAAPRSATRR